MTKKTSLDTPEGKGRPSQTVGNWLGALWARGLRREVQLLLDLGVLALAFVLAHLLRFEFILTRTNLHHMLVELPFVVLLQFTAVLLCGIYSFIWRYIGMAEVGAFARAAIYSAIPMLLVRLGVPDGSGVAVLRVPLSIILMTTVFGIGGMLGLRVLRRALYERYEKELKRSRSRKNGSDTAKRTLFLGAGQAGLMAVRELSHQPSSEVEVVGFLDDDPQKRGAVIHGVKVLGTSADLEAVSEQLEVEQLVITMVQVEKAVLRRLIDQGERLGLRVRIMPALYEILGGRVNVSRFREVRIDDLLGREQVRLDESEQELTAMVGGRRVLVTGAGGSIGSELARQVAQLQPEHLLLVERAEPALFQVQRELARLFPEVAVTPLLADVGDDIRMQSILESHQPHVVLHAAAHKHVPLMEANPTEAVKNNALATWRFGDLAGRCGVERFVQVSTDKAVRPTSIMGTTKRVAELFVQELDQRYETHFVAVRFGNVLDSTGSVIPIFREQIESGGPVTVTHPEMTRYFMTIPEAAQLVLQAGAIGDGGEIFVLDMGEAVKILDLANDMIRLAGLEPGRDVEVVFSGIRPGEKLVEELEMDDEHLVKTRHPKVFIGRISAYPSAAITEALHMLVELTSKNDTERLRTYLSELIPEAHLEGVASPEGIGGETWPATTWKPESEAQIGQKVPWARGKSDL